MQVSAVQRISRVQWMYLYCQFDQQNLEDYFFGSVKLVGLISCPSFFVFFVSLWLNGGCKNDHQLH